MIASSQFVSSSSSGIGTNCFYYMLKIGKLEFFLFSPNSIKFLLWFLLIFIAMKKKSSSSEEP
ncbi:hypothetical protein BLOT_002938 [Blomia tropicalis]|nr:hypothetical protein BLOT_002938 [Blomia tropicalis]